MNIGETAISLEEYVQHKVAEREITILKQQNERLKKENDEIKETIDSYQKAINNKTTEIQRIVTDSMKYESDIEIAKLKYEALEQKIENKQRTLISKKEINKKPPKQFKFITPNVYKKKAIKQKPVKRVYRKREKGNKIKSKSSILENTTTLLNDEPSTTELTSSIDNQNSQTTDSISSNVPYKTDIDGNVSVRMRDIWDDPSVNDLVVNYIMIFTIVASKLSSPPFELFNDCPCFTARDIYLEFCSIKGISYVSVDEPLKEKLIAINVDIFCRCIRLIETIQKASCRLCVIESPLRIVFLK
ncbi:hypothetical protein EDI_143700 [Entamoeba dispar SAW760]|uniref:Uncharacterized protein n=1 Tax=Entamoeba dispar (strain ATCC PRA-260 / SAW760) TaxID=370354 RepID=B0EQY2_ENTDS|nr:uncharacterized protein EDI_143700 [Entamoeba dispar SAW760]EDR23058.1 hypothetical protein EDI_143700 [Entamoeba dispar SAW760]|eukprot:EDR23058.1 hypothetical protein EDI_143700 [Entamoeba dispar SAW760]